MSTAEIDAKAIDAHRRVLVVDDDVDFAEAQAEFLEGRGFEVRVAHDIRPAQESIGAFDAQIALIDLRLGHSNGIELIGKLRKISPELLCIMLTGHGGMESAIEALRQGANDFLRKPVDPDELLLVMERCFDTRHLIEEKREAELARQRADSANAARAEFLARMSHELRTPMNAILGFAQMLQRNSENLQQKHQKWVNNIRDAGDHLLVLIDEVLDIAKVDAGKMELELTRFPVSQVLDQVLILMHELAARRRVNVGGIPDNSLQVLADAQRLNQVLINLVGNAIKYNVEGGRVSIELSELADNRVRIGVSDTGLGIKEDDLEKIFLPFHRVNPGYSETEGTGIGLTITKKLVELMNGSIGVESKFGAGSTFWIELPQAK